MQFQQAFAGLKVLTVAKVYAAPFAAYQLGLHGADVICIEEPGKGDSTRTGGSASSKPFSDRHMGTAFLAHGANKRSLTLNLRTPEAQAIFRRLAAEADVIIEGSRPRALDRLGIDPAEVLAARPGRVWVSITADGRPGPWCNRVGFGDDAAAAAGLLDGLEVDTPRFVGDAIADPLTGVLGAALITEAVAAGGGVFIDLALREVARSAALRAGVHWGEEHWGEVSR